MTDRAAPYAIRPLTAGEFEPWARMTSDAYGQDWREGNLAHARHTLDPGDVLAAFDGGEVVAGAGIFPRVLTVPGARPVPVAGVTLVAVAPTHRRRGLLTALMRRQLTGLHEAGGPPVAALNAAQAGIYGRFGYGPASRLVRFTADSRAMAFLPGTDTGHGRIRLAGRDAARPLLERVYDAVWPGATGWLARPARFWDARLHDPEHLRGGETALRHAVHTEPDGTPTGYVLYRMRPGDDEAGRPASVRVVELAAATRQAYAALWRYLAADLELHPLIRFGGAPDEPLPHLLRDQRALRWDPVDNLWVRTVDVGRALAARRYAVPLDVVLEVADAFCPWNAGRWRLAADGDGVSCDRTTAPAGLRLSAAELGAAYLGGTTLATLAAAGRVEELRPGALARCSAAFRGEREPYHPSGAAFPAY